MAAKHQGHILIVRKNLVHKTCHVSLRSAFDIVRPRERKFELHKSAWLRSYLASESVATSWSGNVNRMLRTAASHQGVSDGPIRSIPDLHSPIPVHLTMVELSADIQI
jgi:hypothetical protein